MPQRLHVILRKDRFAAFINNGCRDHGRLIVAVAAVAADTAIEFIACGAGKFFESQRCSVESLNRFFVNARCECREDLFFIHVLLTGFTAFLKVADGRSGRALRLADKTVDNRYGVRLNFIHSEPHQFIDSIRHQQLR
ncbi:hypothetical protein WK53_27980 [Burkholderia ubonensis]|uniref:Uncharacterized protein n=1 Tax=Burkholderia ubonensis TaxID=101571 RepID=A0AAW3NHL8_9BURK|nr:hypothetical protein WK53_27980 [Burkholderia ubonensis]